MILLLSYLAFLGLVVASALPRPNLLANVTNPVPFSLPNPSNTEARSAQLTVIRQNFQYGPDIIEGEGVYYPVGTYASVMTDFDQDSVLAEETPWANVCLTEGTLSEQAVSATGGLTDLSDWFKFYEDGFKTTIPSGPYSGMLSNGTNDLLFSMERLSTAPFGIHRLAPGSQMSFVVDDATSKTLSTMTQKGLLAKNRLFYVDYRDQQNCTLTEGRYAGASEAFFFIHPNGTFLPLAIRLNRGSDIVYTPVDGLDWTFAKMAFNMNDLWYQQWYHLETTHVLIDIVFEAAIRTLHPDHPVYGLLDRLAYQTFAFRFAAIKALINKGGSVDRLFFSAGSDAATYAAQLYHHGGAGDWLGSALNTDLQKRGLIGQTPAFTHYPFYEDATIIRDAIKAFTTTFVQSYYASDAAVQADPELMNFAAEAGPAQIINFSNLMTRSMLIDMLTEFATKVSVIHGVVNANEPVKSTASLPYHPMAFYQPLPTAKGIQDIVPFMPNLTQSGGQITLLAAFNRPYINHSNPLGANRTLAEMFNLDTFLLRTNTATQQANTHFQGEMAGFSDIVNARTFDANGLSQGMPFVWKALDPLGTPFSLTI